MTVCIFGDLIVPMIVLAGDVNASGNVSSSDVAQVQSQASYPVTQSNFRNDVNGSGGINSTDIATVQAAVSGATLPGALPTSQTAAVRYTYDGDGRATRLAVDGTNYDFAYLYDPIGRLGQISPTANPPVIYRYGYDLNSNVVSRTDVQRNTALVYVPDALNRVRELTMQAQRYPNGTNGAPVPYAFSHEHYAYDRLSRVVGTSRDEDGGLSDRFTYNPAGELTQVNYQSQNNRFEVFGLDSGGNRTSVNANGMLLGWSPNQLNEYTTAGVDLVSNGSEHEITAIQKPTETVNYTHLGDGPLASAASTSQGVYTVGYDALGRCVRRTTNGQMTYYAFSGAHAILELNPADGAVVGNTLFGLGVDEIIARYNAGTGNYFLQDRLGSVRAVVDALGQVTESYRYDAFGAPRFFGPATVGGQEGAPLSASMINNRFLFTGREWVQRYGFYEYRARAYNPTLGRFMSEDPLGFGGGDTNLFRYCGGDPVNRVDPSGLVDVPKKTEAMETARVTVTGSAIPEAPGPAFGGNGLGLTGGGGDVSGGGGEGETFYSGYVPTGSHIPQSRTATRNGNRTYNVVYHDAVNGYHDAGSFGLISINGMGTFVQALTPADLLRGFYGNFGERLAAAIAAVFGSDASKIPAQTIANAPVVLLVTAEQIAQIAHSDVTGYNTPTFEGATPNGTIFVLSGLSRLDSFRTYGHELGNLLDALYFNGEDVHRDPNITWDRDTGAALETQLFGRPRGF